MSAAELARELVYPLTSRTVLMAMVVFFLLGQLAAAAGLFGLWLMIVILPAYFRYLLALLETRLHGHRLEPPGIEMFNWIAGLWTFMPLIVLVGIGWGLFTVADYLGTLAAALLGIVLLTLYPASMAVLAMTHSAFASLNPLALLTFIRTCGPDYLAIPALIAGLIGFVYFLAGLGLPPLVVEMADVYLFFLMFSLTGAVAHAAGAEELVDDPDAALPDEAEVEARAERERTSTLDHAYGLVSRGNRAGGLAHIQAYVDGSASAADDYRWFFEEMLRWEETDPALFFAQRYLGFLLDANEQVMAIKLMSRCLMENPRFRPLQEDRERATAIAAAHGRNDLLRQMGA